MNDNIIINTISRTYFAIVSFFIFIFISLTTIFILLQNGIYIEKFQLPYIKAEQLYIKWDEKIDISLQNLYITKNNSQNKLQLNPKHIQNYIKYIRSFESLFHNITCNAIHYGNMSIYIDYRDNQDGRINITSTQYQLQSTFEFQDDFFLLHLTSLVNNDKKIQTNGTLYFDISNFEVSTNTSININQDINITLLSHINNKKISYKIINNHKIKSIQYLVDYLKIPKVIRYWLVDAIDMKSLVINSAQGFVDFNTPTSFLDNLSIDATIDKLNYTYNKELDAIHTSHTNLLFKNETLYIYPQNAYTYGMYLDKSWLKIDFSNNKNLLTLKLLLQASLNKDVLKILNAYKIKLPIIQKQGIVDTDLEIKIALQNLDVDAKGLFKNTVGRFNYLGFDIDTKNILLKLDNTKISINNMFVNYNNIVTGTASVRYNAHNNKGLITLNADKIDIQNKLLLHNKPLKITYKINKGLDTVHVNESVFKYEDKLIKIEALTMPFDFTEKMLHIPTTYFDIANISTGYIDGKFDFDKYVSNLHVDLLSFHYLDISLNQSNTQFDILYNKKIKIKAEKDISLLMADTNINLSNVNISLTEDSLMLHDTNISIGDMLTAKTHFIHYFNKKTDDVYLNDVNLSFQNIPLYANESMHFKIFNNVNNINIHSDDINYTISDTNWSLNLNSLAHISKYSALLTKYKLTKGKLTLFQNQNEDKIHLISYIKYPYSLLIYDNENISDFFINGKIENKKISLNINKKIKIKIDKDIKIFMKDIGLNTHEFFKMSEDINMTSNKDESMNILLTSSKVFFHVGKDRDVISDTFALQSRDATISAQLSYKDGKAGLKIKEDYFDLHGSGFNDTFMQSLFALAKFKGGTLDFYMKGKLHDYTGVGYIHDTTLLDYKVLNNVLAFVNTVPSLITFSVPDYNKNGLHVETSYAQFHAKDGVFNVSDFLIDSKEIDILGVGTANIRKDTINATLNLKTDLASNACKIPVVGYILFDENSISTSMKITGKLSNPKVESQLARDIIVAPLNIIKRTFLFPFKVIKDTLSDKKEKQ